MNRPLDVLFVHADSAAQAYQDLSRTYSAIEPPTWCLLLAQSCRSKGYGVAILDCGAERLTHAQAASRILETKARVVCFVVYGQNPNSGTTNMIGATALCRELKQLAPDALTCFVGSHVSALPREVLGDPVVDLVLLNEGVYALHNLLQTDLQSGLDKVRGIGFKREGALVINAPERVVPQDRMDIDLPGYAWDLLPYRDKPLDLYRAHFWHAEFNHALRTPFAAIYTSLGCTFKCDFCMINILNREDNSEGVVSANSPNMRFWSPEFMLGEFDKLAGLGVETIRISDEMFFLNKRYYEPLLRGLVDRGHGFRMWSYSRIDTVRAQYLDLFKKAGIGWLALGVEAASQVIRREVSKGSFQEVNIREVARVIQESGIHIISNYIFGFPDDTMETMQQTLNLALELNTEMANLYPCQALPGSPLHRTAQENGWELPDSHAGYAFLSYESQPLPTRHCSSAEVLRFRDEAWQKYFTHEPYLNLVERKFGLEQRRNVEAMASIRLRRKILGDAPAP
ncbi:MAG: cobalamin-dependent protein [Verrucomicrobia bacterium]|jgi:anaerobic magnesium-protoporphyrin IX monomethyl ester cyclase|nr:cobalamin-dependent protein [Verrucomicrobiota bacterium]